MLTFLNVFQNNNTNWFWFLLAIVILVLIIIACIKYPNGRLFILSFLGFAYVGFAVFGAIQINAYLSASGGIIGQIEKIWNPNKVEITDNIKYSFEDIVLAKETGDIYSATITSDSILKLNIDETATYGVYVNDLPCDYVDINNDYVIAKYVYSFKNGNLDELYSDTLTLKFAFYTNATLLSISTENGSTAARYWNYYFNKNTFVVTIDNKGFNYSKQPSVVSGDISNFVKVTYYVEDDLVRTEYLTKGSKINFKPSVNLFEYWLLNDLQLSDTFVVTEDIVLKAYLTPTYTCSYVVNGVTIKTETIVKGKSIDLSIPPEYIPDGYAFDCWLIDNLPIDNNFVVDSNIVLTAKFTEQVNVQIFNQGTELTNLKIKVGDTIDFDSLKATIPTRDSFELVGLSEDGKNAIDLTSPITENMTLSVLWGHYVTGKINRSIDYSVAWCLYDAFSGAQSSLFLSKYAEQDYRIDLSKSRFEIGACISGTVGVEGEMPTLCVFDNSTYDSFIVCSGVSDTNLKTTGSCKLKICLNGSISFDIGDFKVKYPSQKDNAYSQYISIFLKTWTLFIVSST